MGEVDRTRAIYELAIDQPVLDMPELLWKSYIDFEIALSEYSNARGLFERLLDRTKHVKVRWPISSCGASAATVCRDMVGARVTLVVCTLICRAVWSGLDQLRDL